LFLFVTGLDEEYLTQENDYGVDLLLKPQGEKQYFIQVILAIVMSLKKLDKYLADLIYVYYRLAPTSQDRY